MNVFDAVIVVISLIEVQPVVNLFYCYITEKGSDSAYELTCDLDNCASEVRFNEENPRLWPCFSCVCFTFHLGQSRCANRADSEVVRVRRVAAT